VKAESIQKVLVVDDQHDIVDTVGYCLQQEGYEVLTAFNGQEALDAARAGSPDLIILDVMLPKENGYQVARRLREDTRSGRIPKMPRILMLTARVVADKDREDFLRTWSGAHGFMYKPFDLEELVKRVREILQEPV